MQETQEMWIQSLGWEDPLEKGSLRVVPGAVGTTESVITAVLPAKSKRYIYTGMEGLGCNIMPPKREDKGSLLFGTIWESHGGDTHWLRCPLTSNLAILSNSNTKLHFIPKFKLLH